jgi:hypothetical protein
MYKRTTWRLGSALLGLSAAALIAALATPRLTVAAGADGAASAKGGEEWRKALLEERAAKEKRLIESPTSLLTGIDHIRYKVGDTIVVHVSEEGISFSATKGPNARLALLPVGDGWEWKGLGEGVSAEWRGKAAEPGALQPGTVIDLGRFKLQIWGSRGNLQAGVFDREREAFKAFKGLVFYPPDESYVVEARFERFPEPKKVKIVTKGSGTRDFYRYAAIHFTLDGKPQTLTAHKGTLDSKMLLVLFRDETSGKTTYGAGRILNFDEPEGDTLTLDLNQAANVPCAYAPAFHCPLAPRENWLKVAVAAGEKTYPLPDKDK